MMEYLRALWDRKFDEDLTTVRLFGGLLQAPIWVLGLTYVLPSYGAI